MLQAMAIKEHIGYPDHILEEGNLKLDQEYAHVCVTWPKYCDTSSCSKRNGCGICCLYWFWWSGLSLQLNFSEENYFENILENLQAEAHKSLKKLREPVNPDM